MVFGIVSEYDLIQNACFHDSPMFVGQQKSDIKKQN